VRSDRHVLDASPIVGEKHQDEQKAVGRGRDDEEIGCHDLADSVGRCAKFVMEAGTGEVYISRRSPERRRSRASAVRHESAARPNAFRCGSALCSAPTRSVTHEVRIGAGRSIVTWREAHRKAECGKSACCVRCGGNWRRDYGDPYTGRGKPHDQGAAYGLPRQFPTLPAGEKRSKRISDTSALAAPQGPLRPFKGLKRTEQYSALGRTATAWAASNLA
jgi:hypothetical protein